MKTETTDAMFETNIRERVKELRSSDLFMTMSEIARKVDAFWQRVFQILNGRRLPTGADKKFLYECPVCGTISAFKFCSEKCKKRWQTITIARTRCGKLFFRNRHQFFINYLHHHDGLFCSKVCMGK